MENLYDTNGLMFWSEEDIKKRRMLEDYFVMKMRHILKSQNRAFDFYQCEAPLLTPQQLINKNYTVGDVYVQDNLQSEEEFRQWLKGDITQYKIRIDDFSRSKGEVNLYGNILALKRMVEENNVEAIGYLKVYYPMYKEMFPLQTLVLRPETTMGSYAYAKVLLNNHSTPKIYPPLVVWQHGKSFRREQDQPTKFMRLKEFHQLEFQIIYSPKTTMDYSITLLPGVRQMIEEMIGDCRLENSDRTPDYAKWTKDVVFEDNSMEVCSISRRTDFEEMDVLEVAIGTDRCIHCFDLKAEKAAKRAAAKQKAAEAQA